MSVSMSSSNDDSALAQTSSDIPELVVASQGNIATQSTQNDVRNQHLDVPAFRPPRRPSLDSTFSEVSDLSYVSHDFQHTLMRKVSNTSQYSAVADVSPQTWRQKFHLLYLQNYGALLVLASQLFGSGMNVATRLLEQPGSHGPPMHPFQILFVRQSLTALFCTAYALTTKSIPYFPLGPPDRNVRLLLICRGLCGFFGVFGLYFSLLYLPLSEATVLTFLAPILTCYLCSKVLPGQTFTKQQQIAGLVSLCGVVLIARPATLFAAGSATPGTGVESGITPTSPVNSTTSISPRTSEGPTVPTPSQHLLAIGIAMIGVCGATGAITSIRAIGTRAHAFISINYFSVWSSIVSLFALLVIPSVSFRLPGNLQEWLLLLSLGFCGFCLQGLLTMGLAYSVPPSPQTVDDHVPANEIEGSAGDIEMQNRPGPSTTKPVKKSSTPNATTSSASGTKATSMLYTQMLFALSADRIFFGSVPDVWSWIGSGLILAGAIWVATARDTGKKEEVKVDEVMEGEEVSTVGLGLGRVKRGEGDRAGVVVGAGKGGEEEQIGLLTDGLEDDGVDDRLRR